MALGAFKFETMKVLIAGVGSVVRSLPQRKTQPVAGKVWNCENLFVTVFDGGLNAYVCVFGWNLKDGTTRYYAYAPNGNSQTVLRTVDNCNSPSGLDNGGHPGQFYNNALRGQEVWIQPYP